MLYAVLVSGERPGMPRTCEHRGLLGWGWKYERQVAWAWTWYEVWV